MSVISLGKIENWKLQSVHLKIMFLCRQLTENLQEVRDFLPSVFPLVIPGYRSSGFGGGGSTSHDWLSIISRLDLDWKKKQKKGQVKFKDSKSRLIKIIQLTTEINIMKLVCLPLLVYFMCVQWKKQNLN